MTFAYGEQVREVTLKGRSPDALKECERLATALSRKSAANVVIAVIVVTCTLSSWVCSSNDIGAL